MPKKTSLIKKLPMWLWITQLILGVGVVGFVLIEHLPGLSLIIINRKLFEDYSKFLESFPPILINLTIIALFSAIIFHGIINLRTMSKIYRKPDQIASFVFRFNHNRTYYWIFQCFTGSLLAFFISIHLWITHAVAPGEKLVDFVKINARLGNNYYIIFYIAFLTILLYHALNGMRAALIKLGLVTTRKQEIFLTSLIVFLFVIFIVLGLFTLYFFRNR